MDRRFVDGGPGRVVFVIYWPASFTSHMHAPYYRRGKAATYLGRSDGDEEDVRHAIVAQGQHGQGLHAGGEREGGNGL